MRDVSLELHEGTRARGEFAILVVPVALYWPVEVGKGVSGPATAGRVPQEPVVRVGDVKDSRGRIGRQNHVWVLVNPVNELFIEVFILGLVLGAPQPVHVRSKVVFKGVVFLHALQC